MAEDNPFLSFFESMGTGMEAGAKRRSLMQRAERGQLKPGEEVPGLGRTILKSITQAATPANTRLAQDQMKLQAANYALQRKASEDRQAAIDAQNFYKNGLDAKEAELEAKNSIIYTQAVAKDRQLAQSGKWNDFDATIAPEGMGATLTDKYYAQKKLTGEEFDKQNFLELSDNKELLVDSGSYTSESVAQMSPDAVKAAAQTVSGRYGKLDDMLLYIPVDQRASVKTQVLTGTPDQKREAWAMLDRASIEVSSSIGKIQQDIKKLKAEGGADNLASAQQLQRYADNLGKGDESPSYTITKDENGKTTIQVIGGPKADISKTEEAERTEGLESFEILFSTIDQARSLVRENPDLVGSTGQISGGLNAFKEIIRPVVALPQDANRLQVEGAFDTLKTQALTSLGGGSLARLTDKDAKILENNIPQLKLTSSPAKVMQVMDQLEGTISLRYLLNRSRTNTLGNMLEELGASRVGKLAATASRLNFRPGLVDEAIRESINSIDSQTDQTLARQQILDLFTALRDYGFSDAEREPYIQYAETLSAIE